MNRPTVTLFLSFFIVGATAWSQEPVPSGTEFMVNTYTTDDQSSPSVAVETNGDFVFASQDGPRLDYTIVNLTRASWGDQTLFEAKSSFFGLAYDASPYSAGVGKVRYWRDAVSLEER